MFLYRGGIRPCAPVERIRRHPIARMGRGASASEIPVSGGLPDLRDHLAAA